MNIKTKMEGSMKNLIIFTTKYGSVEKCANLLKEKLNGETVIVNLKNGTVPVLDDFDNIILGGSVYMGRTQKELMEFAKNNLQKLLEKRIGLFLNCAEKKERKYEQCKNCFPAELFDKAVAKGFFGDEITWEKCSFFDKMLIRMIRKSKESFSNISQEEIAKFAEQMNS